MSISFIASMAAGNAAQLLLAPPAGARRWRVLRKRADTISAADDAGSNVVYEGDDKFIVDRQALMNGTEYFYRVFYLVGPAWVASASRSVMPSLAFEDIATDVVDIVRERIDLGFAAYVEKKKLQHDTGHIPVLLATPAYDDAPWPIVTVHATHSPAEFFVGEIMAPDTLYDSEDEAGQVEGRLARYDISIVIWSLNGDVRRAMRRALEAIVMANLPVFESTRMSQVSASFADIDDTQTYPAPMYQAVCTLSCIAPIAVESRVPVIRDTEVVFIDRDF